MTCHNCGNVFLENVPFCPICGTPFQLQQSSYLLQQSAIQIPNTPTRKPLSKKAKVIIIICSILAAILFIISIIVVPSRIELNANTPVGVWVDNYYYIYTFNEDGTGDYISYNRAAVGEKGPTTIDFTWRTNGNKLEIMTDKSEIPSIITYKIEGRYMYQTRHGVASPYSTSYRITTDNTMSDIDIMYEYLDVVPEIVEKHAAFTALAE